MNDLGQLQLTIPHPRFRDSYLDAMREMEEAGEPTDLPASIETVREEFDIFVEKMLEHSANPLPGFVPQTMFWITLGDEYIGRLGLRHELNEMLEQFGGHIGYDIRPSMRRRGYGTHALQLALEEARKLGIDRVLVTCSEYNVGSKKIIEANGGVLENMVETPFRDELTCRYWITVSDDQ